MSVTLVQDFNTKLIMERFVPMVTVRRRWRDAAWFDGDCKRAFELKQPSYQEYRTAVNWDLFCHSRSTANRLKDAGKDRYSACCRQNLDYCASANAWCVRWKVMCLLWNRMFPSLFSWWCACFRSGGEGWAVECVVWQKTVTRYCWVATELSFYRPALCGIAFRTREVYRHLIYLDPNGCVDLFVCFPTFFSEDGSYSCPKTKLTFSLDVG